jgi:hypothetical protein
MNRTIRRRLLPRRLGNNLTGNAGHKGMKTRITFQILLATLSCCTFAEHKTAIPINDFRRAFYPEYTNWTTAALSFKKRIDPLAHYPNLLDVYITIENRSDSHLSWLAYPSTIEAHMFAPDGNEYPTPGILRSGPVYGGPFQLPYGSSLKWLLPGGGSLLTRKSDNISFSNRMTVLVGDKGWLLPLESYASFRLKIQVLGYPHTGTRGEPPEGLSPMILFDPPITNLIPQ